MSYGQLQQTVRGKFSHLTNQQLVDRINSRFKAGLNDDDEVCELFRRRDEQGFNVEVGWDTYQIIYK